MDQRIIENIAEAAVKVGINLQPGEKALVATPTDALPLAREIVRRLYRAGAANVITRITDPEMTQARFLEGGDGIFDQHEDFEVAHAEAVMRTPYHRIVIDADDPALLKDADPERVSRQQRAVGTKMLPLRQIQNEGHIKWCIVAYPNLAWARMVFPGLPDDEAMDKLGDAIASASRMTGEDVVADWRAHEATLKERQAWLDEQNFDTLHYVGPGTDLTIGLGEKHCWVGGSSETPAGAAYMPNMPTEEVFTAPHKDRVDGTVRSTKPLSVGGKLIEGMEFRFEGGKVVEFRAEKNGEVLEKMMDSDEGARRLGEVALVPDDSPISASGILYYDTLFDENASCHLALGQSYAYTFIGGSAMSDDERAALGANSSMIHVDFMVGGPELSITGVKQDGTEVPVFRNGTWAR